MVRCKSVYLGHLVILLIIYTLYLSTHPRSQKQIVVRITMKFQ